MLGLLGTLPGCSNPGREAPPLPPAAALFGPDEPLRIPLPNLRVLPQLPPPALLLRTRRFRGEWVAASDANLLPGDRLEFVPLVLTGPQEGCLLHVEAREASRRRTVWSGEPRLVRATSSS